MLTIYGWGLKNKKLTKDYVSFFLFSSLYLFSSMRNVADFSIEK